MLNMQIKIKCISYMKHMADWPCYKFLLGSVLHECQQAQVQYSSSENEQHRHIPLM